MGNEVPIIGITMGDPAGIGPEIAAKALADPRGRADCRPLVIGDARVMEKAAAFSGVKAGVRKLASPDQATFEPSLIDVLHVDVEGFDPDSFVHGKVSAACGRASYDYVVKAIELAMAGAIHATVTNPINKEAVSAAGIPCTGHTEIYAEHTRTSKYTMMLAEGAFRVVHVSTHVSLREACDQVKKDRVLEVIGLAEEACRSLGIAAPRVAVAGLNPHSGEHGLFGREEKEEIEPAIAAAVARGIKAEGPVPADTLFSKLLGGFYDIAVTMYHDQGHIPTKLLGFRYDARKGQWDSVAGVNITLGLPIIRTSVDHGTAFGKAGKGRANYDSLLNAIAYAALLAKGRGQKTEDR
jgi:4-hydroxythreonine-4-phosphate dehydrogenase